MEAGYSITGQFDVTAIEANMCDTAKPLDAAEKHHLNILLMKQFDPMYMASFSVYCCRVDNVQWTKCSEGAGCLVFDHFRHQYFLQIYNVSHGNDPPIMLWEGELHVDQIISVQIFHLLHLLIRHRMGQVFAVEFVTQTDLLQLYLIIERLRTKNLKWINTSAPFLLCNQKKNRQRTRFWTDSSAGRVAQIRASNNKPEAAHPPPLPPKGLQSRNGKTIDAKDTLSVPKHEQPLYGNPLTLGDMRKIKPKVIIECKFVA